MNRRQKKKLRKKGNFKKYGVICAMWFKTNEDGTTDLIQYSFHNGSRKILKACEYTNVYPVACSCDLEHTDNNGEITMTKSTQYECELELEFEGGSMDEYLNKWKEGLKDDSSEE